jgi:chitosanase
MQLIVNVKKLNKRSSVPASLSEKNIIGTVFQGFQFEGEEITTVPNPALGKWYKDRDGSVYWGGGVITVEDVNKNSGEESVKLDNSILEQMTITPVLKKKIEQVVNAFETGSATGKYDMLVKYKDYTDSETNTKIVQVTFGRSQTTEFGHLRALIQDYVNDKGIYAGQLSPYLDRIGKKPSLATDDNFCKILKDAGKLDPIMKTCQDDLFELKYYQPAYHWFTVNGFTLPLSMLVIYDSTIHSGGILAFLRKRFTTVVPANGGNEKEWIKNYVDVRNNWLANHSDSLLQKTAYRTHCLMQQIENNNWDLSQPVNANGLSIA